MAKYSRFDPRNKKSGKHKTLSVNKDFRIRDTEENYSKYSNSKMLKEVMYEDDYWEDRELRE